MNSVDKEVKEIVDSLLENGKGGVYEAHGEDGGVILNALQSAPYGGLVQKYNGSCRSYVDLGNYDFIGSTEEGLFSHHIHVFIYDIYKFVILESQDENPDHGGTCDYASVHMFLKK